MSQRGERCMEEMRELLNRISDSGIEVPQTVREAMCGLHLDQFTSYDFDGFFHDRPVVFMETENGKIMQFAWIVERVVEGRYKDCWMTVAVSAPRLAGQGS